MDFATGAMNILLSKLGDLLVGEYNLQKGVKGEIEELQEELVSMNAALRKVSEVPAEQLDELVKIWAREVRELSYDIEDAVDTFTLRSKGPACEPDKLFSFKGLIDRTTDLFRKAKTNHKIHNIVKDIMEQVKKVSERRDRYKVDSTAARPIVVDVDPRIEGMYRKATELVGIEGPKNELAERLMDEGSSSGQQPKIISIVGFGGLGKTTLANALLQDLRAKFDRHVFVSVSFNPNIKKIFVSILRQLDKNEYANVSEAWGEVLLIDTVREFLEKKRCLCVIDDVWNKPAWDTIKLALQDAKHGSKIIITTRDKAVAEHAGCGVYELKPLSLDDSRKLLDRRLFDSEGGCPPCLSDISGKILKKCGGIPLAIITIASLLASKNMHLVEWEKVNNSIGSGLEKTPDVDRMKKILSLSYNDLHFYLKTCLLSLSKYPEDEVIRKDVLIWSWVAEGFITEETQPAGTSLQEIGESYFSELVNRSLIQPVDIAGFSHKDGQVHACQVHDMILELITQLSSEEGFVTMSLSNGQLPGIRMSAPQKSRIRRLSLHKSKISHFSPDEREQLSKVRSLAVFGEVCMIPPLSCFHVLRVLHLDNCSGLDNSHFNGLGELRYLRFLLLGQYGTSKLPESIWRLESLETLDIRGTHAEMIILPMSFVKLQKLVRLFADSVILPKGLALRNMKSLQELIGLYITPEAIEEIVNLKELRVLRISTDMSPRTSNSAVMDGSCLVEDSILMCLQRCASLQKFEIQNELFTPCSLDSMQFVSSGLQRFMCCGMCMTAFPRWINSSMLSCATTLSIELFEDVLLPHHLEKLAELPSLRFLRLWLTGGYNKLQKINIPGGACAFWCLRHFCFRSASKFLVFQPGAMPKLQRLAVGYENYHLEANNLKDFGLDKLQSLRQVIIKYIGVVPVDRLEAASAVVRKALKDNPNHPSLEFRVTNVNDY